MYAVVSKMLTPSLLNATGVSANELYREMRSSRVGRPPSRPQASDQKCLSCRSTVDFTDAMAASAVEYVPLIQQASRSPR